MKVSRIAGGLILTGALLAGSIVSADGFGKIKERLTGYQEVPAVSTTASGRFEARVTNDGNAIEYTLEYSALEGAVTAAHIHFGQAGVNGGVSAFLCSTGGAGPAGTPACPPAPGKVSGTIEASDVIGPAAQGIAPGEFGELVSAVRAGATYANVHSTKFPGGEIRAQLGSKGNGHDGHGDDDD